MTMHETKSGLSTGFSTPPVWIRVLLGVVLFLAGVLVLSNVALATVISTIFIGATALVAGIFEIGHAFWTKGWGGFLWRILLGVLYVTFGLVLMTQPVSGALILTYILGLLLLLSGALRVSLAFSVWKDIGWIMLLSGVFGILAGLVILTGFPMTGLWVLGLLLAIDLMTHGVAWLAYAMLPAMRSA